MNTNIRIHISFASTLTPIRRNHYDDTNLDVSHAIGYFRGNWSMHHRESISKTAYSTSIAILFNAHIHSHDSYQYYMYGISRSICYS